MSTKKKPAVKKTAKKAPAKKKPSTKKATKKSVAKKSSAKNKGKALVCAKGEKCFWVHEGPILKDLLELEVALNDMSETMFSYHVGKGRNDFADWVESVLKDAETATALRKAKKPHTARKVVVRQLKLYKLPK